MKILCATDFSARAQHALRLGAQLARAAHGSVELVHVLPAAATDVRLLAADAIVFEAELRSDAEARLARQAREVGADVGIHVAGGEPAAALLARASAIGADLIVIGAHGHSALGTLLLGNVAKRVLADADRPVLIVPPDVTDDERHSEQTTTGLRVMAALDGRRTGGADQAVVALLRRLRMRVRCDVTALRLYWPPEEYERLGLSGARDLAAPDADVVSDLERVLRHQVGVLPGAGDTRFVVEPAWGDPAAAILAAARAHGSNLIVMGSESRRGLARLAHPPVAERVARQAKGMPVLFVPAAGEAETPAREVPGVLTALAPTDLSPAGNRAVPLAYALVAAHGGVVELIYVHERALAQPPYAYDRVEGKLSDVERARLERELRALVPLDAEALGITTHVRVVDGGHASDAIIQAAERLDVDAIVIGSHGRGHALHAMLGSVSHAVVRHSRRPVLVVPDPDVAEAQKTPGGRAGNALAH